MTLEEIFARCERSGTGCLLWTGPLFEGKYGGVYCDGEREYVHRLVFELHNGRDLLPGEKVLHRCDTHRCAEPSHLFCGSQMDNMIDMGQKGRSRSQYTVETVLRIREMWSSQKYSQSEIGRRLGIPQTTVSGICRRSRWSHI